MTNKSRLIAVLLITVVSACLAWWYLPRPEEDQSTRRPSSSSVFASQLEISKDLYLAVGDFLNYLQSDSFNKESCARNLELVYDEVFRLDPSHFDLAKAEADYLKIIARLWQARLSLGQKVQGFALSPDSGCLVAARQALRAARYIEDYLGIWAMKVRPYQKDRDPKTVMPLQGEAPHLLQSTPDLPLKVRSGDVLVSRGSAFTSAAIARVGETDVQFSHVALVYSENQKSYTIADALTADDLWVLEAHIEIGSTIRLFKDYLADGNARILLFRHGDSGLAHRAGKISHDFLNGHVERSRKKHSGWKAEDVNHSVPYDFQMRLEDRTEIFCSEVASLGYTDAGLVLPQFPSKISHNDLTQRLGITAQQTFAPGDMEVDPSFKLLAEWRDYRKLQNVMIKDAILTKMYEWMEEKGYKFKPGAIHTAKSLVGWLSRQADMTYVKKELPRNMNITAINTVLLLDQVGQTLQDKLEKEIVTFAGQNQGLLMPAALMYQVLEDFRQQDLNRLPIPGRRQFHHRFGP